MPIRMSDQIPLGFPDPGIQDSDFRLMVTIDYVDPRLGRMVKRVIPQHMYFGYIHGKDQWLVSCKDITTNGTVDIALQDVRSWSPLGISV